MAVEGSGLELREDHVNLFERVGVAVPGDVYLLVHGRRCPLLGGQYFFEKFFARANTCELDVYVRVRYKAVYPDKLLCEVHYLHRVAHVEYEHLSAFSNHGGLEHKRYRLWNGHEVAFHIFMGYGQRAPVAQLLKNKRQDRAAAS